MSNLPELLEQLKEKRAELSAAADAVAAIKGEYAARIAEAQQHKDTADGECAALEEKIRNMAVDEYKANGNKKPATGVEVKLFSQATIEDTVIAREWCFENLRAALVIDPKMTKEYALKFGDVPGVKIERDIPRAQIASKF